VLTQRTRQETLLQSRQRMEAKWKNAQRQIKRMGMIGMVAVVHCTWSRHKTFHYHMHIVAEFPDVIDEKLTDQFKLWWAGLEHGTIEPFVKNVARPRTAEQCGEPNTLYEPADAVGTGIGYIVGDVIKGVGNFGVLGCPSSRIQEVVDTIQNMKRQRLYGDWRGSVGVAEEERKEKAKEDKIAGAGKDDGEPDWFDGCPTCDEAYTQGRAGVAQMRDLIRGLAEAYSGPTYFCKLVRTFCGRCLGG
jgi:hypothetical protein